MTKKICIAALLGCWLIAGQIVVSATAKTVEYRTRQFTFRYPVDFRLSTKHHGSIVHLAAQSGSKYWQNTITIQKHNKRTEECDLPQSAQPDANDRRKIAGRVAFAYSGEDAAMNRYVKTKGYVVETRLYCWRFELIRKGKPFQKFDLPEAEMKRLETQSERDLKKADTAFKTVLDSFVVGNQESRKRKN